MKTAEEKAEEYADREIPIAYTDETQTISLTELRQAARIDYLAGYNEAMRWRDPKEAPQETDLLVKFLINGDIHDCTCLEKDCNDAWHWRCNDWDVETYPIIGWRPID